MTSELLDLNHLTLYERDVITEVLDRAEKVQEAEDKRIRELQNELKQMKIKVLGYKRDGATIHNCSNCNSVLPTWRRRGKVFVCKKCGENVCFRCIQLIKSHIFICNICYKKIEIDRALVNWFKRPTQKDGGPLDYLEFVRTSLNESRIETQNVDAIESGSTNLRLVRKKTRALNSYLSRISRETIDSNTESSRSKRSRSDETRPLARAHNARQHASVRQPDSNHNAVGYSGDDLHGNDLRGDEAKAKTRRASQYSSREDVYTNDDDRHGNRHSNEDRHGNRHSNDDRHENRHISDDRHDNKHNNDDRHDNRHSNDDRHDNRHSNDDRHDNRGTNIELHPPQKHPYGDEDSTQRRGREGEKGEMGAQPASTSMPSIAVIAAPSRRAHSEKNDTDEEAEDIGALFAAYGSGRKRVASQSNIHRVKPHSGSTRSLTSCYSSAGEEHSDRIQISGEICFRLSFDYKTNILAVGVKECKSLAAVDLRKHKSDPYVKTYLLPDKTKNGKRKTRVKRNTLNPVFEEELKYHITKSELESRRLCLAVWNYERFGRNDFLGEVLVDLDFKTLDNGAECWHRLQSRAVGPYLALSYKGDLDVSLKFVNNDVIMGKNSSGKGQLQLVIREARNLTAVRSNGYSDPFCKCYLLPDRTVESKRKSKVLHRTCNPRWNQTIIYDNVSWEDLRHRSLELTVWDYDRLTSNDFLGGCRFNVGSGKSRGVDVPWMDANSDERDLWQAVLDRPNCWVEATLLLRNNMNQRK